MSPTYLLTWWAQDEVTQIAVLYVESFGNPRKFAGTARRVAQRMPVLTVVGARSPAGHRAASHTAAAATPLASQEAMFDLAGVIATRSLGELVDTAALLACQPLPAGNRVAIVANAGGAGALAADACADHGLQVVPLGAATQRALRRLLPPAAVVTGPVDTSAVVTTEAFRACVEEVADDDGVDAVLAVAVPTAFSDLSAAVAEAVVSKPLAVAFLDRAESVRRLKRCLSHCRHPAHARTPARRPVRPSDDPAAAGQATAVIDVAAAAVTGVPCYADPDNAARALSHAARYRAWRGRQRGKVPELEGLRPDDARAWITSFLAGSPAGGWLPEARAAALLSCYGVPLVATLAAATEEEAAAAAAQLGGRVVLKTEAEGLVRRTDGGGVRVDLRTPREVAEGYRALAAGFGPRRHRVLIQPMLADGVEVHIGVAQEPIFGPVMVFGHGGAATEAPGDQVARLAPLTDVDADEMINSVRVAPLLAGRRAAPPVVVGVRAVVDDLLGTASRRQAAQVGDALLGDDDMYVVLGVVDVAGHRYDARDRPVLGGRGGKEHGDVGIAGEIAGPADAVLHARAHDVGGVHVAVDVGLDHAVHRQAAEPADHLWVVADLLRPEDDLVTVAADAGVQLGNAVMAEGEARRRGDGHRTRAQQPEHAVLDHFGISGQRRELPAAEPGEHGVGDVAHAGLQRRQRRGQPPAPYFVGQEV